MRHALNTIIGLALCLAACPPPPPQPEPPPPLPAEATCATVCARWAELGCEMAEPTPAGQSCESVCAIQSHWNLPCLEAALSCSAADHCPPGP